MKKVFTSGQVHINASPVCEVLLINAELKELVRIMGESKIDLSPDEVLMIGGVLELRGRLIQSKARLIPAFGRQNSEKHHDAA
jgi:hypothetical protein